MHLEGNRRFGSLVRIIREMAFSEEVVSFIFIMCVAVVFFTTSIVMLDLTGSFAFGDAEWPIDDPEALGWWFWRTFQHVYRIGIIGDVDFDNIAEDPKQPFAMFCWFGVITFLLTIVMVNALIAIMSNKYAEKMAVVEVEMLRSRWNMMGECTLILPMWDHLMAALPRVNCRRRVHPA